MYICVPLYWHCSELRFILIILNNEVNETDEYILIILISNKIVNVLKYNFYNKK